MQDRSSNSAGDVASRKSANATLEMLDDALSRLEKKIGIGGVPPKASDPHADIAAIRARQEALARNAPARPPVAAEKAAPAAAGPVDIHKEIVRLREELNREMTSTIAQQFAAVREELKDLMTQGAAMAPSDLTDGFNRLTRELGLVASRVENSDAGTLRAEIEELRNLIGVLAQEETLRDMAERWSVIEREISTLPQTLGSREDLMGIAGRLSEIDEALHRLPDSGALDSMEGQIRSLAEAVEVLASQNAAPSPDHLDAIDRRLDEISRAIATVSATAGTAQMDPEPFERIEARLSALASRFDESTSAMQSDSVDRRLSEIADRLGAMHEAVSSASGTGDAVENLVRRLDDVVQRLDAGSQGGEAVSAEILDSLNSRFEEIAKRLDTHHASVEETGTRLFQSVDARMEELAQRIDEIERDSAAVPTFDHMERRIEEIAQMLSSGDAFSSDASALGTLETQIAALNEKLSAAPAADTGALADIGPRLVAITDELASGRDGMIAAARDAAEELLTRVSAGVTEDERRALTQLAGDLRGLEETARSADDRNSRTFEAIHDTLLKVADRIAGLEASLQDGAPARQIADAPPMDYADGEEGDLPALAPEHDDGQEPLAPAAAAALAARAAVDDEAAPPERVSGMNRLAGMVAAKRATSAVPEKAAPPVEPDTAPNDHSAHGPEYIDGEPAVFGRADKTPPEEEIIDEPLEPGSGGPDLAAIMKRVRAERDGKAVPQAEITAAEEDAGKSDFIAAARRAARAAAAEAAVSSNDGEDSANGAKRRAGGFLASRRRPLMLGAAAVVLVALSIPLVRGFLPDSDAPAKVAELETTEPAAVDEVDANAAQPEAPVRSVEMEAEQPPAAPQDAATAAAGPETAVPQTATPETAGTPAQETVASAEPAGEELAADDAASIGDDTIAGVDDTIQTSGYQVLTLDDIPVSAGPVALREAAAEGDPKAIFVVGDRLMGSAPNGPDADMEGAARWYEMAAELGFAPAQFRIGNAYEKGLGVERDLQAAITWYQLAAEQGNVSAMHNLAVLLATEIDGRRDMTEAARWFLEAAERGVKDSQVNLGILSARGEGVPQDLAESYKWLALAAKAGDKDAAAKRDEVAKFLQPEQLEMAKGAVKLWKPRQPEPAANEVELPEAWKIDKDSTASVPVQQPVDMKKAIRNIQAILNNAGFDAGVPDGIMGDKTRRAVKDFQKAHNLLPTGEIDAALVDKLLEINRQS